MNRLILESPCIFYDYKYVLTTSIRKVVTDMRYIMSQGTFSHFISSLQRNLEYRWPQGAVTRGDGCISRTKALAFTTVVWRPKEIQGGMSRLQPWLLLKGEERNRGWESETPEDEGKEEDHAKIRSPEWV